MKSWKFLILLLVGSMQLSAQNTVGSVLSYDPRQYSLVKSNPLKKYSNHDFSYFLSSKNYDVDNEGNFLYQFQIQVPEGTHNMTPQLALQYNSSGGNGILGKGWNLQGIPVIKRDESFVISYNSTDHYTYNGQKLIKDSTTGFYHTQKENFEKIELINPDTPAAFWIVSKLDGTKIYLGSKEAENSPQSDGRAFVPGKSQPYAWSLTKAIDLFGNYYIVEYKEFDNNGAFYPEKITYTKNSGITKVKTIYFSYSQRSDHWPNYRFGGLIDNDNRLYEIRIMYDTQIVRTYNLTYLEGATKTFSKLTRISMTGSDNLTTFPEINFIWNDENFGWKKSTSLSNLPTEGGIQVGDLNKDGYKDILCQSGSSYRAYLNNGGSSWVLNDNWTNNCSEFLDIRTDGYLDGFYDNVSRINNGTGYVPTSSYNTVVGTTKTGPVTNSSLATGRTFIDLNGDGMLDYLWGIDGDRGAYLNTGTTWKKCDSYIPPAAITKSDGIKLWPPYGGSGSGSATAQTAYYLTKRNGVFFPDLNGDGLPDFFTNGFQRLNNGEGWETNNNTSYNLPADPDSTVFADLNGDGLDDIMWNGGARLNTGSGWSACSYTPPMALAVWATTPPDYSSKVFLRYTLNDVNGDGLLDLIFSYTGVIGGNDIRQTYINNGTTWSLSTTWNTPDALNSNYPQNVLGGMADIDGNGTPDTYAVGLNSTWVNIQLNKSTPQVIKQISDFKTIMNVTYQTIPLVNLTFGSYPALGNATASPMTANVVTASNTLDPNLPNLRYDYSYGTKVIFVGKPYLRQSLGTSYVNKSNPITGLQERSYYTQDPTQIEMAGFPTYINTFINQNGKNFIHTQKETIYSKIKTSGDTASSLIPGPWYVFPIGEYKRTYNGAEATFNPTGSISNSPTAKSSLMEYLERDNFGNATTIVNRPDLDYPEADEWITLAYQNNATTWTSVPSNKKIFRYGLSTGNELLSSLGNLAHEENWIYPTDGKMALTSHIKRLSEIKNAITAWTYDTWGNQITVTDPNGNLSKTEYDPNFHCLPIKITNAMNQIRSIEYNLIGLPRRETDANEKTVIFNYDPFNRIKSVTLPEETTASYLVTYPDEFKNGTEIEFPLKKRTERWTGTEYLSNYEFFDGLENLIQTKKQDGANYITQDILYDGLLRKISESIPYVSNTLSFSYSASAKKTQLNYDELNRPTRIVNFNGESTSISYGLREITTIDPLLNKNKTTVEGRKETKISYSKSGSNYIPYTQIQTINTNNQIIVTHSGEDGVLETSDDWSQTSLLDAGGRVIQSTNPDSGTTNYTWKNGGQISSKSDTTGRQITWTYDSLNRQISQTTPDGTTTLKYDSYTNGEYSDAIGRLTEVKWDGNSDIFYYDNWGRLKKTDRTLDGKTRSLSQTYDKLDRLKTLEFPNDGIILHSYKQGSDNLSTLGSLVSNLTYNPTGTISSYRLGNGTTTTLQYFDETDQTSANKFSWFLKSITTKAPDNSTVNSLNYTYDKVGNILKKEETVSGQSDSYFYDDFYRLTSASYNGNTKFYSYKKSNDLLTKDNLNYSYKPTKPHTVSTIGNVSISTDDNGNTTSISGKSLIKIRAKKSSVDIPSLRLYINDITTSPVRSWDIKNDDWEIYSWTDANINTIESIDILFTGLGQIDIDWVNVNGTILQSTNAIFDRITTGTWYDGIDTIPGIFCLVENGSLRFTSIGSQLTQNLTWDSLNHLIKIDDGFTTELYSYDPSGERCRKISGDTTTYYFFPGYQEVYQNSNLLETKITYNLGNQVIAEKTRKGAKCTIKYLHNDNQGSPIAVTDELGKIVQRFYYGAWGENQGTSGISKQYTGQEFDPGSSFQYYHARYYSPELGRFLSIDPILDNLDFYSYCKNNPINYTDPTGMWALPLLAPLIEKAIIIMGGAALASQALQQGNFTISIPNLRPGNIGLIPPTVDNGPLVTPVAPPLPGNTGKPAQTPALPNPGLVPVIPPLGINATPAGDPFPIPTFDSSRSNPARTGPPGGMVIERNPDGSVKRVTTYDKNGNWVKEIRPEGSHGIDGPTTKKPTTNTNPETGKTFPGSPTYEPSTPDEIKLLK